MTYKQSIQGCKTLENGKSIIPKSTTYQNQNWGQCSFVFFISIAMLMQTFLIEIFIKAIVDSHAVVKKIIQNESSGIKIILDQMIKINE